MCEHALTILTYWSMDTFSIEYAIINNNNNNNNNSNNKKSNNNGNMQYN